MTRRTLTVEDLWSLPRVGSPAPTPDGRSLVVPVTTYSMDGNQGTTRLWLVPASARTAGDGGPRDPARPLTTGAASSQSPAVSPDGGRLAFVRKPGNAEGPAEKAGGPAHTDVPQLYLMPLDGGEPERLTDLPLGVAAPQWLPDGRRIAFISELYADAPTVDRTAARHKALKDNPVKAAVTENRVYRVWDRWITDGRTHHIFVLDLDTRELMDLTPGWTRWMSYMDVSDAFVIAPDGREIAFECCRSDPPYDPVQWGVFAVPVPARVASGGRAGRIRALTPRWAANAMRPVYSPDGRYIVHGMQREVDFYADRVRLVAYERRSRAHTVLTETWDRSVDAHAFGGDSRTIYLLAESEGRSALHALDLPAALKNAEANPPRQLARGGTFSPPRIAGDRIFTTGHSLKRPPEVISVGLDGRDLRPHTAFTAPIMKEIAVGEVEEFIFDGAGGHPVQMFVYHPPGPPLPARRSRSERGRHPTRRRPLVHLVHGGPHGTFGDTWHWRWNAQVFSAGTYTIAMVNFHGSTSWGQAFTASIHGRWGDQPYTDVMRATDELIEAGIVDPKRMAVAGGSYGGYLVSWIASQTDRFACIINHAGVCDLQTQYASDFTQGRQRSMGGEPWDRIEAMDRWSPLRHSAGFSSPMLVLHGEKDYRVPYVEGLQIYNVYKARKLPARLVCYPDENHWILKPRNSVHWYGEVLGWLDRWIGKGRRARAGE